jgi:hypothetical protein
VVVNCDEHSKISGNGSRLSSQIGIACRCSSRPNLGTPTSC